MFKRQGLEIVMIGVGDDTRMIESIAERLDDTRLFHFDLSGYPELVALFQRAHFYVGGDSGPMHLAASAGLDLVALFGPSKESIWAPLGKNSRLLRGTKSLRQKLRRMAMRIQLSLPHLTDTRDCLRCGNSHQSGNRHARSGI